MGNLIVPMKQNTLKIHTGIQILTLGKILFSEAEKRILHFYRVN